MSEERKFQNNGKNYLTEPASSSNVRRKEPSTSSIPLPSSKDKIISTDPIEINLRELSQCIKNIASNGNPNQVDGSILRVCALLHCMITNESIYNSVLLVPASAWSDVIDVLVSIVSTSMTDKRLIIARRRGALQCLWLLSLLSAAMSVGTGAEENSPKEICSCFQQTTSWFILVNFAHSKNVTSTPTSVLDDWWLEGDRESVLLLCGMVSCLASSYNTSSLIEDRCKISMAGFLYNKLLLLSSSSANKQDHRPLELCFFFSNTSTKSGSNLIDESEGSFGSGLAVLDSFSLQFLTALATCKGQSLPGLLVLVLGQYLIRYFLTFCEIHSISIHS